MTDNNVDVMFLTETWLRSDDPVIIKECTLAGYSLLNVARGSDDAHGGIAIIYKTVLKLSAIKIPSPHSTFEIAAVTDPSKSVCYAVLYRPPPSAKNGFKTHDFLMEFEELIGELTAHTWELLLLGDFNVHVDRPDKPEVAAFLQIAGAAGLRQHVSTRTHKHGHTLDLVFTRDDDKLLKDCQAHDKMYSDHFIISCIVNRAKPQKVTTTSVCHNFRALDKALFISRLKEAFSDFPFDGDVDDQVEFYNKATLETLDQLCPPTKRVHYFRSHPPWYTNEIHLARRTRRKLERCWRKSPTDENSRQYLAQIHVVCNLIRIEKSLYYSEELSGADVKKVFHVLNSLLNRSPTVLPSDVSSSGLPERFANFFEEKVIKIRSGLSSGNQETSNESTGGTADSLTSSSSISAFETVEAERISKIIRSSPNKSCLLDPIPTWLLKESINTLLPFITSIVQTSLSSGIFPVALKEAIVTPLIKKSNLDRDSLKNYRPVSNVPFLSKVIEKAALSQISDYLEENDLYDENQSAYRRWHSTETALLKVQNDILRAIDNKLATFVVFLDLSAAFDSIDHEILLQRLANQFGFTGGVISWFESYLSDRSVRMKIANDLSQPRKLQFGVPQGSVVGPQLFSLYTKPLADIIKRRPGIQHHSYADDVQLYISANPKNGDDVNSALASLSLCINDLQQWMQCNMLKLNCEKTEFLVAASPHFRHLVSDITLTIGDAVIKPSTSVRSLGVVLDPSLGMNHHVSSLSSTLIYLTLAGSDPT